MDMPRIGSKAVPLICALLICTFPLASCGDSDEAVTGGSETSKTTVTKELETSKTCSWWLVDAPGFHLADSRVSDDAFVDATGQRWILDYSNGPGGLQMSAWDSDSRMVTLVQKSPKVGSAKIAGFDVTLRRGAGIPSKEIPPSVGASWIDGDLLITFGGGALSETELRGYLADVRCVSHGEWEAATTNIPKVPG